MYSPVTPVVPVAPARRNGRAAWPLAAICCLALLGFLIAATIVLALIPVYLPSKLATTTTDTTNNSFYVQYSATPPSSGQSITGTITNPADIGAAANVGTNGAFTNGQAQEVTARRRRRSIFGQREKRALKTNLYFLCVPTYAATCISQTCRANVKSALQKQIKEKISFTTNVQGPVNGVSQTVPLTLTFVGFSDTKPAGFIDGNPTSFNFTAKQSGLYNVSTTWQEGVVPYGNCTVTIPSGITVTIPGSQLDTPVRYFDIAGTLAVGQGASRFDFKYPTTLLIQPTGTLQDLTTGKTIGLPEQSLVSQTNGGTTITGSTVVTTSAASRKKRRLGASVAVTVIRQTIVIVEEIFDFPRVQPFCRRSGPFSSPFSYVGGFSPSGAICRIGGCGVYIPTGVTITTLEFNGVLDIRIDILTVVAGGGLRLGSPGVSGFKILSKIQMDISGVLDFVASGGSLSAIGGIIVNLLEGATFTSSDGAAVILESLDASGVSLGKASLRPGKGPYSVGVSETGAVTNGTGSLGNSSASVTTTLAPGQTAASTTLAPGQTAASTTLAPGQTAASTTLAPGQTAASTTLAPGATTTTVTPVPTPVFG